MRLCLICEKKEVPFLSWLFGRRVCEGCEYLEWQAQIKAQLIPTSTNLELLRKGRLINIFFRSPKDMEEFIHSLKGKLNIKVQELGFIE